MSRLKDTLSMHWPLAVGVALFVPAAWKYWSLGEWEAHVVSMALAAFGFVATVAPDEVSSWTGRYGWTYGSFWTYPPTYLRFVGLALQVGVLVWGFV
jgi:hypothetical protein